MKRRGQEVPQLTPVLLVEVDRTKNIEIFFIPEKSLGEGCSGIIFVKDLYYSVRRDHLVQGSHSSSAHFIQPRATYSSDLRPEGLTLACQPAQQGLLTGSDQAAHADSSWQLYSSFYHEERTNAGSQEKPFLPAAFAVMKTLNSKGNGWRLYSFVGLWLAVETFMSYIVSFAETQQRVCAMQLPDCHIFAKELISCAYWGKKYEKLSLMS